MALRVLLADESSTIKRVMQLALQDYGVEVKSVPIGVDVIPVSKSFKPDLVFVDVLLQKKSGYEVAKDIKQDPQLKNTPVVLMWSGFMELDEAKVKDSGVDRRLEKPFDAEVLRQMVQDLVPKTKSNPISSYLSFPQLPDFAEEAGSAGPQPAPSAPVTLSPDEAIYALPEISETDIPVESTPAAEENFAALSLSAHAPEPTMSEEGWSHQDLTKFKIEIPNETPSPDLDKYMIPAEELNLARVETTGDFEEVVFGTPKATTPAAAASTTPTGKTPTTKTPTTKAAPSSTTTASRPTSGSSATDQVLAEQILREEARALLEKIAWQVLPEIAERVVKDELNKLLKQVEKTI